MSELSELSACTHKVRFRQPIVSGYNSHYVRTTKAGFVQTKPKNTSYDELVILQEGQVVPAFILTFDEEDIKSRLAKWEQRKSGPRRSSLSDDSGSWIDLGKSADSIKERYRTTSSGSGTGPGPATGTSDPGSGFMVSNLGRSSDEIKEGLKTEVDRFIERQTKKRSISREGRKSRSNSGSLIRAIRAELAPVEDEEPIPLSDKVGYKSTEESSSSSEDVLERDHEPTNANSEEELLLGNNSL